MTTPDQLKSLLHQRGMKKLDQLLLCLAYDAGRPKQVKEIKQIAWDAGLRAADKWNVSAILRNSGGQAIRTTDGWELNAAGRVAVADVLGVQPPGPVGTAATSLRKQLSKLAADTAVFVDEAIGCLDHKLYRAAVVLSWVGAVDLLYQHVVANHLAAFNAEAVRRDLKHRPTKNKDDLARMKESDFLDILVAISIVGKNVKEELKKRLDFRNACGHPNSLKLGETMVASHIELLILNVYSVF